MQKRSRSHVSLGDLKSRSAINQLRAPRSDCPSCRGRQQSVPRAQRCPQNARGFRPLSALPRAARNRLSMCGLFIRANLHNSPKPGLMKKTLIRQILFQALQVQKSSLLTLLEFIMTSPTRHPPSRLSSSLRKDWRKFETSGKRSIVLNKPKSTPTNSEKKLHTNAFELRAAL